MAYQYPIDVYITHGGDTANEPSCGNPYLILVTTATSQNAATSAMTGNSSSTSCFEITGTAGENRIVVESSTYMPYGSICAVRLGSNFSASPCGRLQTTGITMNLTCTINTAGNVLVSSTITGNTALTSHGVPYYKRVSIGDIISTSNANKYYVTKSQTPYMLTTSSGFATNQYLPVKYFGFSGSYFHAGAISARTYMTYTLEFNLFVQNLEYGLGAIEIYMTETMGVYPNEMQDSYNTYHYGYTDIYGESSTLTMYTDKSTVYLGINIDIVPPSGQVSVFRDGSQIYNGILSGNQEIALVAATINTANMYAIYIGGN